MKPGVSEREKEEQMEEKASGDLESPVHTTPPDQTHILSPAYINLN